MHSMRVLAGAALAACSPTVTTTQTDFGFDGTCVNCHARPVGRATCTRTTSCAASTATAATIRSRSPTTSCRRRGSATDARQVPRSGAARAGARRCRRPELARFFFANGIDDDGDGADRRDRPRRTARGERRASSISARSSSPACTARAPGEFVDTELPARPQLHAVPEPRRPARRDGRLRRGVARALDGGGGCHQQTVDVVRRSIMVNQTRGHQRRVLRQRELAVGVHQRARDVERGGPIRAPARSAMRSTTTAPTRASIVGDARWHRRARPAEVRERVPRGSARTRRIRASRRTRRATRTCPRSSSPQRTIAHRAAPAASPVPRRATRSRRSTRPAPSARIATRGAARTIADTSAERSQLAPVPERELLATAIPDPVDVDPAHVPRVLPAQLPGLDDQPQLHVRHVDPAGDRAVQDQQPVRPRPLVGLLRVPRAVRATTARASRRRCVQDDGTHRARRRPDDEAPRVRRPTRTTSTRSPAAISCRPRGQLASSSDRHRPRAAEDVLGRSHDDDRRSRPTPAACATAS